LHHCFYALASGIANLILMPNYSFKADASGAA